MHTSTNTYKHRHSDYNATQFSPMVQGTEEFSLGFALARKGEAGTLYSRVRMARLLRTPLQVVLFGHTLAGQSLHLTTVEEERQLQDVCFHGSNCFH